MGVSNQETKSSRQVLSRTRPSRIQHKEINTTDTIISLGEKQNSLDKCKTNKQSPRFPNFYFIKYAKSYSVVI